jgi:hypothetical protein
VDVSYAAGLIDGEGYLGISHVKGADTYAIRVQVAMVTKGSSILTAMKSQWGGRITHRPPETERNAPKDVWVLDGESAFRFLVPVRPFLLLKGDQADCLIQLWESIRESRKRHGRKHWDDGLRRHARHLMLRVQEGNQRGPEVLRPAPLPDLRPLAEWRWGEWWEPEESLFGPVPFTGGIPTSGQLVAGRIYPLNVQPTASSSSPGLLPTPQAHDAVKGKTVEQVAAMRARGHGVANLNEVIENGPLLLRTPTAQLAVNGGSQHPDKRKAGGHGPTLADEVEHLLPTPTRQDGTKGGPNQRGSSGDLMLPSAVMLLPTPTAMDSKGSRGHRRDGTAYGSTSGTTLTDAVLLPTPHAQLGEHRRDSGQDPAKRRAQGRQVSLADVVRYETSTGAPTDPPSTAGVESSDG